jgi:hypothetical protein
MKSKSAEKVKVTGSRKAIIDQLVAKRELSEVEASWLLKAWAIGGTARRRDPFGCYVDGFLAGMAIRIVEQEIKVGAPSRLRDKKIPRLI